MELLRSLATLAEPPAPEHRPLAALLELGDPPERAAFTDLFELQLYPWASFYLGAEGMLGGEARDRIAGFWRALGQEPPAEPDHLATMLALQARLAELEEGAADEAQRAGWRRARRAWLWEHLLSWLGPFCDKATAIAPAYYRRWARLLAAALAEEAATLGGQDLLPLHLREAAPLPDPRRDGGEAFLAALLAPARSGVILVRTDLERAARDLGLGSRAGERRFVLRALLGQDAAPVLGWLAAEAGAAAARYRRLEPAGRWRSFWADRAEASGELLAELARSEAGPGLDGPG